MDFSLSNYLKSADQLEPPAWAKTESSKKLYIQCVVHFNSIKLKMDSQKQLSVKERKIVLRHLAKDCRVDPSLLSLRRQPDLLRFVAEKNLELEAYWEGKCCARKSSGKKLNKSELLKELCLLRTELKALENSKLAEALTLAIERNLAESKSRLVMLNQELSTENSELRERNTELSGQLRDLMSALNRMSGR